MIRRIAVLITTALVCACAAYGQIPVFGPETIVCGTGQPVAFTKTFTVSDITQTFTMSVENGRDQSTRTSSAVITISGTVVFSQDAFNNTIQKLEKQLSLKLRTL